MQYAPWYAQRCNQSPDVPARSAAARNYSYSNETIHAGLTLLLST